MTRDIDSGAKFIGAGAFTVGIADIPILISYRFFSSKSVSMAVLFILTRIQ